MNLEEYGVVIAYEPIGIEVSKLTKDEVLLPVINNYATYLKTDSIAITGSLFLKRYAVLTVAAALDYYGLQGGNLDWWQNAKFNLNNFQIEIYKDISVIMDSSWQRKYITEHLSPLVEIIAKECKINKKILWENIAVRLNTVFRRARSTYSRDILDQQFKLLSCENPTWFENGPNPLKPFLNNNRQHISRNTCCRYYQLEIKEEGMPYCLVCPFNK